MREAIEILVPDAGFRRRMEAVGWKKLKDGYSMQAWGSRVSPMLRLIADNVQHR